MKKVLSLLIMTVFLLPMLVKADMLLIYPYYNSKVVVDGEAELHLVLQENYEYSFDILYDSNYFDISEENITTNMPKSVVVESGGPKEVANKFDVTVTKGKISITTKINANEGIGDSAKPEVDIRFIALKEGSTTISVNGRGVMPVEAKISIVEKKCPAANECEKTEDTKPVDENKDNKVVESKNNNDLYLYISLGVNILLIISLVFVALKRKKNIEQKAE